LVYFICFAKQSLKAYVDKLEKFIDSLCDLLNILKSWYIKLV
jgi:hypothetical protein